MAKMTVQEAIEHFGKVVRDNTVTVEQMTAILTAGTLLALTVGEDTADVARGAVEKTLRERFGQ